MREWEKKLVDSQRNVMKELVDQLPSTMGVRGIVEDILDNLASGGATPKYRFIVVKTNEGDAVGLQDEDRAADFAEDEENYVIDMSTCELLTSNGDRDKILEVK